MMKKVTSTILGLGLMGYLGVQYYVLDQVQRVAYTIPGMETAFKFGVRGLSLQLDYKEDTSFLKGKIYPSWDLMALKGRGLISHEGFESKYYFALHDIWDIPYDLTFDELLKELEERADQGRAVGVIGFDIDHLNWEGSQIDGLHSQLKLMPGQESFDFSVEGYRFEHQEGALDVKNFNLSLNAPNIQRYYLAEHKQKEFDVDFHAKVNSMGVFYKDKKVLNAGDWNYDIHVFGHDDKVEVGYRVVFDQFKMIDADKLWVFVKDALHLNELPDTDLLKQMLKLSQEEGTQNSVGSIDFSLNKPADSLWENCVDNACEGKLVYSQEFGFSDLGVKVFNSSHIHFNEGFKAKIEFDRKFDDIKQRDAFININKKKYQLSLDSFKKDPDFALAISSMQDTVDELITQYVKVDQGNMTLNVQNRLKLPSDLTTCALSQGSRCQALSQNIDLVMAVSWLAGGKLELTMPEADDMTLRLKGLDGFDIEPAVKYIVKTMKYQLTSKLVEQLIVDNSVTLIYKAPGELMINGHSLKDLDLKPSQEKQDLRQHQKKWQRPRA